jgi:hypothetical protein
MLAVAVVAVIVWVGIMMSRRSRLLELAQHFRQQSLIYATLEQRQLDFNEQLEKLEHEVRAAEPPAPGSDAGAWKAYREYVADVRKTITRVRQEVDACERYGAVRRYLDRLVTKYRDAAKRPWLRIKPEPSG